MTAPASHAAQRADAHAQEHEHPYALFGDPSHLSRSQLEQELADADRAISTFVREMEEEARRLDASARLACWVLASAVIVIGAVLGACVALI